MRTHVRTCCECSWRYGIDENGPWLDPMLCPRCGSDDTVGEVRSLSLEDELALISGEITIDDARRTA